MFDKRIRQLRKEHKMRQQDLADLIVDKNGKTIGKSTIAGYEKGFRRPRLDMMNQLAEIFNTSVDYLLGLTDNREPSEPTKDLSKLLNEKDFHYGGQPVSEEDLEFILKYLERVSKSDKKEEDSYIK